jgi:hypothetical protein
MPVTGPIPGLLSTPNYRLASHRMRPGDKIAIITDGIDRQSSATADFPNRLFDRLSKEPGRSLSVLKEDLEGWLENTLGPAPKDDWTLMIGEYRGSAAHNRREHQDSARRLPAPLCSLSLPK